MVGLLKCVEDTVVSQWEFSTENDAWAFAINECKRLGYDYKILNNRMIVENYWHRVLHTYSVSKR